LNTNLLWEQVGWIGLDAAACAIGDASAVAADQRLDLEAIRTHGQVVDLTTGPYPAVVLKTGADLDLPVEVACEASGKVEAVRMELVEDVAELSGSWDEVGTLDLSGGLLLAADPFGLGPHRRIDLHVKPGVWRVEVFHPNDEESAGPLGLRALWTSAQSAAPRDHLPTLKQLCKEHHAWVRGENDFQRRARLLQALWRSDRGLEPGRWPGKDKLLGSRLTERDAAAGANFLTPFIWALAKAEASQARAATHVRTKKLIDGDRLAADLLSSQPMCFNLFGELSADLQLATRALRRLWPHDVAQVVGITFEESPGRGDPDYLGNRSAADVFIRHTTPSGGMAFIAIETKYHEDLSGKPARHKPAYDEVAEWSGAFEELRPKEGPLQQLWLDHLLALSMLRAEDGWESGRFVLAYPERNEAVAEAAYEYEAGLTDAGTATFGTKSLQTIHDAISQETDAPWVGAFAARYLDLGRVDARVRD
jgi:hypothetical protein